MKSIVASLRNLFSGSKAKAPATAAIPPEHPGGTGSTARDEARQDHRQKENASTQPQASMDEPPVEPMKRRTIQAPLIVADAGLKESDEILIKAEPSLKGDQCKFMVNRNLFAGHSWWFPDFESAAGSPLAETLFGIDDVETVLVHESTLTITRRDKSQTDWRPLARETGAALRRTLQSGSALIAEKIVRDIPPEDQIRAKVQEVIDMEVNPGVAGHGGKITLLEVKGNTVTIQMGGGCQGCSAADLTLKAGIHTSFRKALPAVGAILDETDHEAGLNPYYS